MSPALFWTTVILVFTSTSLSFLGVITNGFTLYLFYSDSILYKTTRLILGYASLCDIGFLAITGIYEPLNAFQREKFKKSLAEPVLFYLLNTSELLRNWLSVLLSLERLFYILRPLEFKHFWTIRVVIITISLITTTSLLLSIPSLLLVLSRFGILESAVKYLFFMHFLHNCVFLSLLPECLMICVLVSTTASVRKRNVEREKLGKQKTALGLAKSFLVTFFVLTLPSIPTTLTKFFVDYLSTKPSAILDPTLSVMTLVTNLCSVINSLAGFFIYMCYTARYRDVLIKSLGLHRLANIRKLFQIKN
nr:hypothetical protein HmN_000681400 [Hymenolepis microstoma]